MAGSRHAKAKGAPPVTEYPRRRAQSSGEGAR